MDRYDALAFDTVDYWRSLYVSALNGSINLTPVFNLSGTNLSLLVEVKSLLADKDDLLIQIDELRRDNGVLQGLVAGKNLTGLCAETIASMRKDIDRLNTRIYILQENISDLDAVIAGLHGQINFLSPYKTNFERASSNWTAYLNALAPDDFTKFITPSDPVVVSNLRVVLGADADANLTWSDMRNINLWVQDHITNANLWRPIFGYNWSFWQSPSQVIKSGFGDCSDMARLAASLMLAEDIGAHYLWCVEVVFGSFSRTVIVVDVEQNQMLLYDPLSGWQSNVGSEASVLKEYEKKVQDAIRMIPVAYNNREVHSFGSTVEFCQWL